MKSKFSILAASFLLALFAGGTASAGTIILDGQILDLCEDPQIDLDGGSITATTDCGGGGGSEPLPNVSLTVTDTTITVGESVTISWNISNASSCNATGGISGWEDFTFNTPSDSGSQVFTFNNSGNVVFGLSCVNSENATRARQVQIGVSNPSTGGGGGTPANCTPPTNSGDTRNWSSVFDASWPAPNGNRRNFEISRGEYLALRIDTADAVQLGKTAGYIGNAVVTGSSGTRLIQVSKCPGDFSTAVGKGCRIEATFSRSLNWVIGTDGANYTCDLEPNETYYINVIFGSILNPLSTTCSTRNCFTSISSTWLD